MMVSCAEFEKAAADSAHQRTLKSQKGKPASPAALSGWKRLTTSKLSDIHHVYSLSK
jgi:hypothetical protein